MDGFFAINLSLYIFACFSTGSISPLPLSKYEETDISAEGAKPTSAPCIGSSFCDSTSIKVPSAVSAPAQLRPQIGTGSTPIPSATSASLPKMTTNSLISLSALEIVVARGLVGDDELDFGSEMEILAQTPAKKKPALVVQQPIVEEISEENSKATTKEKDFDNTI